MQRLGQLAGLLKGVECPEAVPGATRPILRDGEDEGIETAAAGWLGADSRRQAFHPVGRLVIVCGANDRHIKEVLTHGSDSLFEVAHCLLLSIGRNERRNGSKEADSDRCNDEWNGKIRSILSLGNRANSPDRQTPSNGLGALFFP